MMNTKDLESHINYSMQDNCLFGINIYEYDIRQANINILYSYGLISEDYYKMLRDSDRNHRQITIGKLISYSDDGGKYESIKKIGIEEAKRRFFVENNISEGQIVRIANDAIFLISPYPVKATKFQLNPEVDHQVEFVMRNHYSSYLRFLNGVSIFFKILPNDDFDIDVKGISKDQSILQLHSSLLSFIGEIIFYKERSSMDIVLNAYKEFYEMYINRKLDVSYYREFDKSSIFRLNSTKFDRMPIYPIFSNGIKVEDLDISYNLCILRELYAMILR